MTTKKELNKLLKQKVENLLIDLANDKELKIAKSIPMYLTIDKRCNIFLGETNSNVKIYKLDNNNKEINNSTLYFSYKTIFGFIPNKKVRFAIKKFKKLIKEAELKEEQKLINTKITVVKSI